MVDLPPPEPSSLRSEQQAPAVVTEQQQEAPQAACPTDTNGVENENAAAFGSKEADTAEDGEEAGAPVGDGKRAKRKAFKALEIAEQVHQVQEWLTAGKRPNQIRQLCSERWGLQTRVAEMRIHDARRQMVVDANVMDRTDKVGQMLQQLEQVLEQALQMKQGSNAIGALRLQADLLQLLTRQN